MVEPEAPQAVDAQGDPRLKAEVTAARESARIKSELVATVSHELRTPLAGVLGFAELLLSRDLDDSTRTRYTQAILGEAQRLTALIDDFLDLERIEAGHLTLALESFDLSELVKQEVNLRSAQSPSHTLEFSPPGEPLVILGDRQRVGQVITNLLSNAIKYSPAGGVVRIMATSLEGFATVRVRDFGLGIPADQQGRVFTKFFRVDSTDTRKIGGTGLGLSLCQELVAAHGGKIGFESTEGLGSAFWFELPTAGCASNAAPRARVLVIEDDRALAASLRQGLALDNLDVELAMTGEAGLERTLAMPPAAICLNGDLQSELDGWQVLVRLKANPATASVPVIVSSKANARGTATALGAAEYLPRPCTCEQMRRAVARHLAGISSSVLVVGKDGALRRLIVETLARDGGDLREAADSLEALALIEARQPDVLVVDIPDPGIHGFAVVERLLSRPETRGLPIVALSGRTLSMSEQHFLAEHSVSLIQKSEYSADQLRRFIHLPHTPRRCDFPDALDTETSQHAH